MTELQSIVIGIFTNVLGDQILLVVLTGVAHLVRYTFTSPPAVAKEVAFEAPEGTMALPPDAG